MEVHEVSLEVVAGRTDQLPKTTQPQVAFAGKSNVGKSSLINTLINRKALARTSSQPGKTQTINFYNVENKLYFVDLPGYGYAKVSKKERERWGQFIDSYIHSNAALKQILLLIDIRHSPNEHDKMMYDWIVYNGYKPLIVATKMDKIKRSQIQKHIKIIKEKLNIVVDTKIIPFSAKTKKGKDEIWHILDELIE